MAKRILFLCCLIAGSYAGVDISPVNPYVKAGEELTLTCRSSGSLTSDDCAWALNGGSIRLKEGTKYTRHGSLDRGECGIKFIAGEIDQGKWVCTVYDNTENAQGVTRETNVTLFELPRVSLKPPGDVVEVVADEETTITCGAENARPEPQIKWMIGGMPLDSTETNVVDRTENGRVSVEAKLVRRFTSDDHKKAIRCTAVIASGNEETTVATLQVLFGPRSDEQETIQYGFVVGQPGTVVVNISANPAPSTLTWFIGDVQVDGFGGSSTDKHFAARMISSDDVLHKAMLNIEKLTEVDATQTYVLKVTSLIHNEEYTTEYRVKLSSEAEPVTDAAAAGGSTTAGIIIAVIIILLVLVILFVARAKGLLCFKRAPAAEEKQAEREPSETESANQNPVNSEENVDASTKPENRSLSSRLRNMYGSIKARTGSKSKGEKIESDPEAPKPIEKRPDSVIYAELDLREVTRPPVVKDPQNPGTEYAEIIGIVPREEKAEDSNETKN